MSDYQVKDFIDFVNQNPKEVLFALTNDQNFKENTMKALITLAEERENYLKTAEMSSEQNYNQIDGIIQ